jgi:hypothetical protein
LKLFGARSTSSETRAMLRISVEPRQGLIVKPLFRVRKKQRQKRDAETADCNGLPAGTSIAWAQPAVQGASAALPGIQRNFIVAPAVLPVMCGESRQVQRNRIRPGCPCRASSSILIGLGRDCSLRSASALPGVGP